jgi:hypothetical protein
MKSLRDVVLWLQVAGQDELSMKTICLKKPWSCEAEARVVPLDVESRLPTDAQVDGHKYFLEASVAREVLDVLRARPTPSTTDDACNLLIYYAENDAYPDWVYK